MKILISKCCGSEVRRNKENIQELGFYCLNCRKSCDTIEQDEGEGKLQNDNLNREPVKTTTLEIYQKQNKETPTPKDWTEEKMKEFEKMIPEEVGNGKLYGEKGVEEWLELNSEKHLYEDIVYSEPMLTLDIEKVRGFLKSSLTQQKEAIIKEIADKEVDCELKGYKLAIEEVEGYCIGSQIELPKYLGGGYDEAKVIGYNNALKQLLEAIKKMKK